MDLTAGSRATGWARRVTAEGGAGIYIGVGGWCAWVYTLRANVGAA